MARKFNIFGVVVLSLILYPAIQIYLKIFTSKLPEIDLNEWWGPENDRNTTDTSIRRFEIKFSEKMIKDLKYRLKNYRPFSSLTGSAFQYGFNSEVLENWTTYWAEQYPFEEREKLLNKYPQFKTNIQGLDIHFIRVAPQVNNTSTTSKQIVPLLILHGWPSSTREFYEAIPYLIANNNSREFGVEVVIPSLPGYGFSDAASRPGFGADKMAVVFRNLMQRLGYTQYYIQGGDWGALVGRNMATFFPKEVLGYHTNFPIFVHPMALLVEFLGNIFPPLLVDSNTADRMYPLSKTLPWIFEELGYVHVFTNKPDTFGIALSDSPSGLLATVLQKFSMSSNKTYKYSSDGGLGIFSKDQLLDNIMIYWITNSISSSMRMYAESLNKRHVGLKLDQIPSDVPTWVLLAKHDVTYQPPFIIKMKHRKLLHATLLEDGGHFLALEQPKVFANDVLAAIEEFKRWHGSQKKVEL